MMGETPCVHFYGLTRAQGAAFEFHGQLKLIPVTSTPPQKTTAIENCPWLIVDTQSAQSIGTDVDLSLWTQHATVRRPSDNNEDIVLYRKKPASSLNNP
jgi:hypothetical protein